MLPHAADAAVSLHVTHRRSAAPLRRVVLLAGDISPVDVLTHIPIICEDQGIPYIYLPSKEVRLGWADVGVVHWCGCSCGGCLHHSRPRMGAQT